jgi:hypothetical protein
MLRAVMLVSKTRFLFLQVCRIRQQHPQEIDSRRRSVHNASESLIYKTRQVTGMVDVGVRENHGVDGTRIDGRFLPVSLPKFLQSLEQSTVDQNPLS